MREILYNTDRVYYVVKEVCLIKTVYTYNLDDSGKVKSKVEVSIEEQRFCVGCVVAEGPRERGEGELQRLVTVRGVD